MLREAPNSLVQDPMNEGASRLPKKDCVTLCSPNCLPTKESTVMAKLHYCERSPTHFPVVFAGEAYVGEGTVLNMSVPGCAIHSRKRVMPGEDQIRLGRLVKKEVPLALPPQSRTWQEAHFWSSHQLVKDEDI